MCRTSLKHKTILCRGYQANWGDILAAKSADVSVGSPKIKFTQIVLKYTSFGQFEIRQFYVQNSQFWQVSTSYQAITQTL